MAILGELAVVLLPLLLAFFILIEKFSKKQGGRKPKLPPGPRGLPVIGNLHQLGEHPHQTLCQLSKQYGALMHLQLGRVPAVVISSAQMAEQVLKTHDLLFCSRPTMMALKRLTYNFSDVATSPYNASWRELRKIILLNLLSPKMVEGFRHVRDDEVGRMMGSISHVSSISQPINLSSSLLSFSNNIICRVTFGRRMQNEEAILERRSRFCEMLMESQALFMAFFASDYFVVAAKDLHPTSNMSNAKICTEGGSSMEESSRIPDGSSKDGADMEDIRQKISDLDQGCTYKEALQTTKSSAGAPDTIKSSSSSGNRKMISRPGRKGGVRICLPVPRARSPSPPQQAVNYQTQINREAARSVMELSKAENIFMPGFTFPSGDSDDHDDDDEDTFYDERCRRRPGLRPRDVLRRKHSWDDISLQF